MLIKDMGQEYASEMTSVGTPSWSMSLGGVLEVSSTHAHLQIALMPVVKISVQLSVFSFLFKMVFS